MEKVKNQKPTQRLKKKQKRMDTIIHIVISDGGNEEVIMTRKFLSS